MKTECPFPENEKFKYYWELMIDDVKSRSNFSQSHLLQFKLMCDAYCQYDMLKEKVEEEGVMLVKISEKGETFVTNPHVTQLNRVINQIKDYSKMLGLILIKDETKPSDNETDDWL